ncbi:GGDEF domain-containing protein [Noviherbaspirillum cavernae]|uniref:diguanylate cyclase n=1 Tax=Noviherbaspirillum cavernae TaxID=2320862 RepID=A0A418X344_9BURK|nr:GGDEF domain-containing protein [Noviherbaspirillum cavernae]RJG06863.1 GGDEF domain-containing protein [Noviherbaspirillum cavernae]
MNRIVDLVWHRLAGLMPGELRQAEFGWLGAPYQHPLLLARRRATLIVNRVRLFAYLFAVLTPLWSIVDFLIFPVVLWLDLALMRFAACVAFASLLMEYKPNGNTLHAYRAIAFLFAIPTVFDIASHFLIASHQLADTPAAIVGGYAFLPFVLLAGLSIFPLTLLENLIIACPILILQFVSGYVRWPTLDWASFAGAFWLLLIITGMSALAGMSQLAFMLALVRQALRDPLTGTFSRNSGEEVIELQFSVTRRSGKPLAIAFIDLDHFKSVNDRFGHEAGDHVLIATTETISRNLRRGDVLARWGGEEFVLIMPNTDIKEAESALVRLRHIGFGMRPDNTPVTASIGIAERIDMHAQDWKTLVDKADQRMYRAKQGGRDRIVCTDGPETASQPASSVASH